MSCCVGQANGAQTNPTRATYPTRVVPLTFLFPVNKSLWVVQILLAIAFGMAGAMKLFMPIEGLTAQMGWPGEVPSLLVRFIGLAELAGALGLILPSALRIRPSLTPLAAAGLVIVMVLAAGFHVVQAEAPMALPSLILGALAAFVAWGRSKKAAEPEASAKIYQKA